MDEKYTENNIEYDEFNLNTEQSNFDNLINKLHEIRATIALLEKKYFDQL